jgi:XTP/dITP diphosphohydrolase
MEGTTKMDKILVITGNKSKAEEISAIIGLQVEAKKLDLSEIQSLSVEEVAKKKASSAYDILRQPVIVDDTGMNIEALNGLPGALVSWFLDSLGPKGLLGLIKDKKDRKATVSTCIAFADSTGVYTFVGTVYGKMPSTPKGKNGFGYDPIFIPEGSNKTYAEMSADEKNKISMRNIALTKLSDFLKRRPPSETEISREQLESDYQKIKKTNPRKAAEMAYVLARLYLEDKNFGKATEYGKQSISLFDKCKMNTITECSAIHTILCGIVLPDLIHQDIVRNRLSPLQL